MKDELIWRVKQATMGALDALGSGAVVARGHKSPSTAPSTPVGHKKAKVVGKFWRGTVGQERLAQPLGLLSRYHAASSEGT